MKQRRIGFFGLLIAVLVANVLFPTISAHADSVDGLTNLHLKTTSVELGDMSRGETYQGVFTLTELTDIPATVKVYTSAFSMKNQTYEPLYEGTETYRNTIKDWITFPDGTDYIVPANSELDIRFAVEIPANALGGSQYCAIIVELVKETTPDVNTGEPVVINATGRVALPIYADIDGPEIVQSGEMTDWIAPSIVFSPPIRTEFHIVNTGNVLFPVDYEFSITDVFKGDDTAYAEKTSKNVFPDTERIIFHEWPETPYLGLFNIKETITYLGRTEDFSHLTLIIPLWLVVIFLLIIALGIIAIVRKIQKDRKAKDI